MKGCMERFSNYRSTKVYIASGSGMCVVTASMEFEIIEFEDLYQSAFREFNIEWLKKFNLLESHDLEVLDDPHQHILKPGGAIYLVRAEDRIVGSAAIMKAHEGIFEL